MRRLALVGILGGLVAGCPTTHSIVRSCVEAADAPSGTACEGFGDCGTCTHTLRCAAGVLTNETTSLLCDVGPVEDASRDAASVDAGRDAGTVDAGPCAPHPPASGTGCHVGSDCDPSRFEMCFAPGASRGCGPCVHATRTCASDADCAPTDLCRSFVDPCSVPNFCGNGSDVTSTACVPRCTATSCAAGESCEEATGRCRPDLCIGGAYTCPAHTHCQDTAGGDPHGCARDACAFDADCGCGAACLGGSCYDTLGTCASPAA